MLKKKILSQICIKIHCKHAVITKERIFIWWLLYSWSNNINYIGLFCFYTLNVLIQKVGTFSWYIILLWFRFFQSLSNFPWCLSFIFIISSTHSGGGGNTKLYFFWGVLEWFPHGFIHSYLLICIFPLATCIYCTVKNDFKVDKWIVISF